MRDGLIVHRHFGPGLQVVAGQNLEASGNRAVENGPGRFVTRDHGPVRAGEDTYIGYGPILLCEGTDTLAGLQIEPHHFARNVKGIFEHDQAEARALRGEAEAGDLAENGGLTLDPLLAAINGLQQHGVVGYLLALEVFRFHPVWATAAGRHIPTGDDSGLADERDLAKGCVEGVCLNLFEDFERGPGVTAVNCLENSFLEARCVAMLRGQKPEAEHSGGGPGQLAPASAGFQGLPDAFFGHHPAGGFIEEEHGEARFLEWCFRPFFAAIAGDENDRFVLFLPIRDEPAGNATFGGRKNEVVDGEGTVELAVPKLDIPVFGSHRGDSGASESGEEKGGGEAAKDHKVAARLRPGPEERTSAAWFTDSSISGDIRASASAHPTCSPSVVSTSISPPVCWCG